MFNNRIKKRNISFNIFCGLNYVYLIEKKTGRLAALEHFANIDEVLENFASSLVIVWMFVGYGMEVCWLFYRGLSVIVWRFVGYCIGGVQ